LNWRVEAESFVEQTKVLEGICDLAEEVTIVKNSSAFCSIIRVQPFEMVLPGCQQAASGKH
jgi:hypothetical protein